jgi:CubicO group peptidase (beta-lactamase class C family)
MSAAPGGWGELPLSASRHDAIPLARMRTRGVTRQRDGGPFRKRERDDPADDWRGEGPSIVVADARNGRVVREEGFGLADKSQGTAATPATAYSIASVTRPFTATAVVVLAEQRVVELDRPINDCLGPLTTVRGRRRRGGSCERRCISFGRSRHVARSHPPAARGRRPAILERGLANAPGTGFGPRQPRARLR